MFGRFFQGKDSVIFMAMIVRYNAPANRALSHSDKNAKSRSKNLEKLASGMKINSAQDDAASLAISSRMRVKLRALDQDAQNVQNGSAILNTAEGGIQQQIDLIRTIRAKVIDAANDHNTEEDRQTIQKELDQLYTQIENIAYETDYNTKKPLIGDTIFSSRAIGDDIIYGTVKKLANSDLGIIPDVYETLDGIKGPFDIFQEWSSPTVLSAETMTGYSAGKPEIISIDFSNYTDPSQLNNVGILIKGNTYDNHYVFTDDTSKRYQDIDLAIPLGDSVSATIDNLVRIINNAAPSNRVGISSVSRDGMKLIVTTYNNSGTNKADVGGISDAGGTVYKEVKKVGTGAGVSGTTSGGVNNPIDADDSNVGAKATVSVDLSGVEHDSGFTFNSENFRIVDPAQTIPTKSDVITLTKGTSSSGSTGSFNYTFDGDNITFTAKYNGSAYNGYSINGSSYTYKTTEPVEYTAYTGFVGTKAVEQNSEGVTYPYWELDLSGMTVDDFSAQYSGKTLKVKTYAYKFYDSSLAPSLEGLREENDARTSSIPQIDIDNIRQRMNADSSLTLADALRAEWNAVGNPNSVMQGEGDKIKFTGTSATETVSLLKDNLRHYDINFAQLDGSITMPDDLYGKGFQAYCATDSVEWFNFIFTDGTKTYNSSNDDIKPIHIDVSNVHNSAELVQAIYDQATPILTGSDPTLNHFMRVAANSNSGGGYLLFMISDSVTLQATTTPKAIRAIKRRAQRLLTA